MTELDVMVTAHDTPARWAGGYRFGRERSRVLSRRLPQSPILYMTPHNYTSMQHPLFGMSGRNL